MNYSEAAYFDGIAVAHCAAWQEHRRLITIAQAQSRLARARCPGRSSGRPTPAIIGHNPPRILVDEFVTGKASICQN